MSKRKRLRTSGEGVRPPKPPKNTRLRDSEGARHSFQLGPSPHPEESEGRSGPPPSVEQSGEEPGQMASSSLDKEAVAPSRLLAQPEKEPVACPPSQNSVGRFVPQFAKPRKAVTRLTATREEVLGSEAFSLKTAPEPSAQQAGSQSWEESPGLTVWEARVPRGQTQADGTHSRRSVQNPVIPVSSKGDSQSEVSSDVSPEWGMVPLASERAGQNYLLEQGINLPGGGGTEAGGIPGDLSQKGHLPSNGAEEQEPDRGAPQEEGAQGGAGVEQEKGESALGLATWDLEPGSAAQVPTDPMQTLSRAGREAEGSCSSPRHPSLRITVMTDVATDPTGPEQRALEVAGPGGKADTRAPTSPNKKAPDGGHSGALLRGTPLTRETTGGRGEAGQETEPPGDILGSPAASLARAYVIQEPTICARDSSPVASEMGPVVDQTGRDQEGLGSMCALPLLSQTLGEKAAELGSQSHEQDLGGLSLCLGASAPLHREAVDAPPRDARAHQGGPGAPTDPAGQPKHAPDSTDQAMLEGFPAMELDFLPDSQIKDALEATNFGAPNEQFPAGSVEGPCWPGTSLGTDGSPLTMAQPRPVRELSPVFPTACVSGSPQVENWTHKGIQPCEVTRMEDATDTVRGLIVELSNLNRLIMNAHRDLEAFKRLNYRKAKSAGKAPMPYTSKGAGTLPRGEQSWSDL
ncbi:break repair meiotic recombinase recruitment factor 1 [Phyllostomus hastatus]|uniref:break repair meiotic recombinase recruitment factor 1 n=1 Tax=Phyllostomus hastatus TaxID=9423 RepID=UPI001E67FFDF|nr:break repair meiotic recombinase recruitment factor 1 [Phyllostomus hastatus]XP_045708762.1 break repair meiotic recombinase recruitment factor 1 [Phyllostomus hastatus]XP_045708763.1 break repair meiotic recombinase recruitment factor 1 [Phyllostomus hastatus]